MIILFIASNTGVLSADDAQSVVAICSTESITSIIIRLHVTNAARHVLNSETYGSLLFTKYFLSVATLSALQWPFLKFVNKSCDIPFREFV